MYKKIIFAGLLLAMVGAPELRADKFPLVTESAKINPAVPRPEPVTPPAKPAPKATTTPVQVQMQNLYTGETRVDFVYNPETYMLPELSGCWLVTVEEDGQMVSAEVIVF